MSSKPSDASRNVLDSIQHAVGINVVDVGAWLGPAVAAVWIWMSMMTSSGLDLQTPLAWADSLLADLGMTTSWPASAQSWLSDRPSVFWVALAIATYTAGREVAIPSSTSTITWAALMTAACIKSPILSLALFLAAGLILAAAAQLLDLAGGELLDLESYLARWSSGPGLTVGLVVAAPALLLGAMLEPYRERFQAIERPGAELGVDLGNMPDAPMAESPAREVLAFLARVLLLSSDDDRLAAYRRIKHNARSFSHPATVGTPLHRKLLRSEA